MHRIENVGKEQAARGNPGANEAVASPVHRRMLDIVIPAGMLIVIDCEHGRVLSVARTLVRCARGVGAGIELAAIIKGTTREAE